MRSAAVLVDAGELEREDPALDNQAVKVLLDSADAAGTRCAGARS